MNELSEREQKYLEISTDFRKFGAGRKVGCLTQFIAIYRRNWLYLVRNPRSLNGILFNGVFSAVLNLCLYWKVGVLPDNFEGDV